MAGDQLSQGSPAVCAVARRSSGEATILALSGIVDMAAAPMVADHVKAVLRERPSMLIVDLTEVTFLASAGMSVLMEAHYRCGELGLTFRVVARGSVTLRPMHLLGIDNLLHLYPTVDDALIGCR